MHKNDLNPQVNGKLVEHIINCNIVNNDGNTGLQIAKQTKWISLCKCCLDLKDLLQNENVNQ